MLDLDILPATAEEVFDLHPFVWEGPMRTLLCGTRNKESPLSILREHESTLVREIQSYLTNKFANRVKLTLPSQLVKAKDEDILFQVESYLEDNRGASSVYDAGCVAFLILRSIKFPPPADRNVNMLPFIFGEKESLPSDLQCYYPLVAKCPCNNDERGKVGYLSVHESFVDATKAQRREGLHIEAPGIFRGNTNVATFTPGCENFGWGWGTYRPDKFEGGIYMASSVSNTSEVWDALVDKQYPNIVDKHGGCEHLRSLIGEGTKLAAGDLIWMTDCTPHEALPQEAPGYRQFFRVVSPYISHWYEKHSTKNPKVGLPDWVEIVKGIVACIARSDMLNVVARLKFYLHDLLNFLENFNRMSGDVALPNMEDMGEAAPAYHPSRQQQPFSRRFGFGYDVDYRKTARIRLHSHPKSDDIDPKKMKVLPTTAENYHSAELEKLGWDGNVKEVLSGTRDKESPLNKLREHECTIIREIYSYISNRWAGHVKLTIPAALVGQCGHSTPIRLHFTAGRLNEGWRNRDLLDGAYCISKGFDNGFVAFSRCGYVEFPPPADRNVNMLPFIFGSKESLPEDLQCYHPLIEQCPYMRDEIGKVGYLTVHESYVDATTTQRREGLHIESPGVFQDAPDRASFEPAVEHPWGGGMFYGPDRFEGGIYIASSVSDTSEVWDALVDKNCPGIVDKHGGCEYLRPLLGKGTKLQAGELIWMTDCTPHEALPQETSGYRQFFRVVSPYISHWYSSHCTSNPKVDLPKSVKIVEGNKFESI